MIIIAPILEIESSFIYQSHSTKKWWEGGSVLAPPWTQISQPEP